VRVSRAARCHVRGGLAHPQSEVRIGAIQQGVRLVSRAPVAQWEVRLGNGGLPSAELEILANWRDQILPEYS
jgi:hypothetical protein